MTTKKQNYPLVQVYQDVADSLRDKGDYSATTIRCAINDHLDGLDKDGYRVKFDYNQQFAVDVVRKLLGLI